MKYNNDKLAINADVLLAMAIKNAINDVFPPSCGIFTAPKNPENIWEIKVIANIYDLNPKAVTEQALQAMLDSMYGPYKEPTK
jgi:hypothetical protein